MTRLSTSERLTRLDDIAARLKSDLHPTVSQIALEFGVSVRTINRDIEILRQRGLPIEGERGRGGGLRLDLHWGVGRVNLSYGEAVDLLISLAIAEQMKSPLFLARLAPIRRKIEASFSPSTRDLVKSLRSRILIGVTASIFVQSGFAPPTAQVVKSLHSAFLFTQRIKIVYRTASGEQTAREIEPHYLLLSYPVWYILAWDHLRQAVRSFRYDRMVSATLAGGNFKLLPIKRFESALEGIEAI